MIATLPSGYTLTIDANGWSLATHSGGAVAEGPLRLVNGAWFFDSNVPFGQAYAPTIASASVSASTVRHLYTGAVTAHAEYRHTIDGNDLLIEAEVTNLGTTPLSPGFQSPRLLFADWAQAQATSNTLGWDSSHTRAAGLSYPSSNIPVGATYVRTQNASGVPINVCAWSREDPREAFMTVGQNVYPLPGRTLVSWFQQSIPPGGTRVFKWAYRFGATNDIPTLLGGYAAHVRAARSIAYQIDRRPVAQFAHLDVSKIRPDNPYGYDDGGTNITRRFDKPEGVADYITRLVPKMQQAKCQGLIAWQPQGIHPRGVQYRPDFDVFPPSVLANLPTLIQGFTAANLTIGLLSRPGVVVTSSRDVTKDTLARQAVDMLGLAEVRARVQWAKAQGFKGFYLDSFITDAADHLILSAFRAETGPSAGLFTEHQTALSLSDAAGYVEVSYTNGQYVFPKAYRDLCGLYDTAWIVKFRGALPPGGYVALFDYLQAQRLTPLVEDWWLFNNYENIPALLAARSWT